MKREYTLKFLTKNLKSILEKFRPKLVYFFGSAYKGKMGPLSDIDLAVLWPEEINAPMIKSLELQNHIKDYLKEDRFEIGSLNGQNLSFCYTIIKEGALLYGRQEDKVSYETSILNQYLDFDYLAREYNRIFDQKTLKNG